MASVQSIVEQLSLREKAAQVIFPAYSFDAPDLGGIADLVQKGVGGICLFRGSVFEVPGFLNQIQRVARWPLLVCSDLEDGAGEQIKGASWLPSNMAVGAAAREDVARLKGLITAAEGRALGIHWNLAPVVDVNVNPGNSVVSTRSFGDTPGHVVKMAAAYLKGLSQGKMLNCIKHFPGLGGVESDGHLTLPSVGDDRAQLESCELAPFKALASQVDAIMTAHLMAPALDGSAPMSLSAEFTYPFVREKLKFDGLVVTDSLIMPGITDFAQEDEVLLRALRAGADVLLVPRDPWTAISTIQQAVSHGKVDLKILDNACRRIFRAKERAGILAARDVAASEIVKFLASPTHRNSGRLIAEASVTLVKDEPKLLPLKPGGVGYIAVVHATAADTEDFFIRHLSKDLGAVEAEEGDFDVYVVGLFLKPRPGGGRGMFEQSQVERILNKVRDGKKVVLVSFGSPFLIRQFPGVSTYVCAYSDCDASQEAAARALVGKIPFHGKLPVRMPPEFIDAPA